MQKNMRTRTHAARPHCKGAISGHDGGCYPCPPARPALSGDRLELRRANFGFMAFDKMSRFRLQLHRARTRDEAVRRGRVAIECVFGDQRVMRRASTCTRTSPQESSTMQRGACNCRNTSWTYLPAHQVKKPIPDPAIRKRRRARPSRAVRLQGEGRSRRRWRRQTLRAVWPQR